MNHDFIEKNIGVMIVLVIFVISFGGLAEILPLAFDSRVTEPIEGMHPDLPIVEDPDLFAYYREEMGGLMLGLFEPVAGPWGMKGIPEDFSFGEINPDWDRMMPYIEKAI